MASRRKNRPTTWLADPRAGRNFRPDDLPLMDGGPPPALSGTKPEATESLARKLQFAFIYYHLNQAYERLLEVRRRQARETTALRQIEKLLIFRDRLEDECAPYGIYAEPVLRKGRTINLHFCSPRLDPVRYSGWADIALPPRLARRVFTR